MSTRRTVTVALTSAQYAELAAAVDDHTMHLQDRADVGDRDATRDLATLNRAWDALSTAWHGRARG